MADKKLEIKKVESSPKCDKSLVAYSLGIVSIVLAFFTPLAGVILGIIGLVQSKSSTSDLAKKAKTLNIIGLVFGLIIFIASLIMLFYYSGGASVSSLTGLPA